uniref:Putative secreted protein n=1 Tax=Ixodes ricinus TaxID=34613 RepID=A0A6B0U3M6_IXORI
MLVRACAHVTLVLLLPLSCIHYVEALDLELELSIANLQLLFPTSLVLSVLLDIRIVVIVFVARPIRHGDALLIVARD